jgi:hypothetical protein
MKALGSSGNVRDGRGFVREEKYIATGRVSPDAAARRAPPSPSNETARRAHWQARKKALREAQGEKQGTETKKASSSTCGAVALVPARWPWEHQPPHGPRTTPCIGSSKDTQTQLGSWGGFLAVFRTGAFLPPPVDMALPSISATVRCPLGLAVARLPPFI